MTVRNEQPATLAAGDDYDDFDDLLDASSLGAPHVVAARQALPESMREHLRAAAAAARNAPPAPQPPAASAAHQGAGIGFSAVVNTSSSVSSAAGRMTILRTAIALIDFGTSSSTAAVWEMPQQTEARIGLWGPARSGKSTFLNALLDVRRGLPFDPFGYSSASGLQVVDLPGVGSADAQFEMVLSGVYLNPRSGQNREIFAWTRHLTQTPRGPLPIMVFGADAVAVPPPAWLLFSLYPGSDIAPVSAHPPRMARYEWIPAGTAGHGLRMALSLMRRDRSRVLRESRAARGAAHDTAVLWHHLACAAAAATVRSTAAGSEGSWRGSLSGGNASALWTGLGTMPVAEYVLSIDAFRGYLPRTGGVLAPCPAGQGNWPHVREGTLLWDRTSRAEEGFGGRGPWAGVVEVRARFTGGIGEFGVLSGADAAEAGRDAAVALLLAFPSPARIGARGRERKAGWRAWQPGALPGMGECWGRVWQETGADLVPAVAAHGGSLLSPRPVFVCALLVSVPGSYRWPAAGVPPEVHPGESQDRDLEEERGEHTGAVEGADAARTRTPAQLRPSPYGTDVRIRRRRDVHRDLKAWVLNEHGHTEGIPVRLAYTAADPYVVCLIFRTSRGQVVWNLARELLSQALDRRAGTGDVVAWSQDDERLAPEERSTFLLLRPGGRLALLGVSREQLRAFLAQTWGTVASGAEYDLCMLALADIERELHSAWTSGNM